MTAPIPGQDTAPVEEKSSSSSSKTSANVRVVSRVRPLAQYELENGSKSVVIRVPHISDDEGPETLQINGPEQRWFELDAVLDESCSQQLVYEKSGAYLAISEDLFSGYNCTILAYGQTGAGKVRNGCVYIGVCRSFPFNLFLSLSDVYHGHGCQECGQH
jgi:hypothetical protein